MQRNKQKNPLKKWSVSHSQLQMFSKQTFNLISTMILLIFLSPFFLTMAMCTFYAWFLFAQDLITLK